MGKRKSSKPPPKKAASKLDTSFNCPFCNSNKSVHCTLDLDMMIGTVECSKCQNRFTDKINHLTEPIDLYSDWIDECEQANS